MRFQGELTLNLDTGGELQWPVNTTDPCKFLEALILNLPDNATSLVLSVAFVKERTDD